jgi:hypothetical protein
VSRSSTCSVRRLTVTLSLVAALTLALAAGPAGAAEPAAGDGTICAGLARVGWDVDLDDVSVRGATVAVQGCDDGEPVGLQLIIDDGDVPDDGPLFAEVVDEVASFDLSPLGVGVEPVVGVRVFLVVQNEPVELLSLTIEQRFFNPAGNEQQGLRRTSSLLVAPGASYLVPGAGRGYTDVACADVSTTLPPDLTAQGAGTFTVSDAGTHVVCYQQLPGQQGGPGPGGPGVEPPQVLGVALERDIDPTAAGSGTSRDDGTTVLGRVLARTGIDAALLAFVGAVLLAVGGRLVLHRRRLRGAGG